MSTLNSNVCFGSFGRTVLHDTWRFDYPTPYNIMHYVKSGKAHYTVNGETREFRKDFLYIFSGFTNLKRTLIPGESFDHVYFDFSTNQILKNDVIEINTLEYPLLHSIAETTSLFFLDAEISPDTYIAYRRNDELYELSHKFFEIIIRIVNSITPLFTNIDIRISKALDYIHKNFNDETLSIQRLADYTHLSVTYFNTLFYNEIKITPYKYIMDFRLNHAYKLLTIGEPIKYVADVTGYSNVYSFSKAFKQRFSVSPGSLLP